MRSLCTDDKERVFVVGGISAGIACAFRAPIGGVMFALEEAISFFDAETITRAGPSDSDQISVKSFLI